jgi:hypothetical protein
VGPYSEAVKRTTLWVGSSLIATLLLAGFGAGETKRYEPGGRYSTPSPHRRCDLPVAWSPGSDAILFVRNKDLRSLQIPSCSSSRYATTVSLLRPEQKVAATRPGIA